MVSLICLHEDVTVLLLMRAAALDMPTKGKNLSAFKFGEGNKRVQLRNDGKGN